VALYFSLLAFRFLLLPNYISKHKKDLPDAFLQGVKSPSLDFERIKIKLTKKEKQVRKNFADKHSKSKAWLEKNEVNLKNLRETSRKALTAGIVSGSLLLSAGSENPDHLLPAAKKPQHLLASKDIFKSFRKALAVKLKQFIPEGLRPLKKEEETGIEKAVKESMGVEAKFELEGNRLNTSYGLIGGEQHLKRYPGDHLALHDEFVESGMAPNLGAFGHFASGASEFTTKEAQQEKYYVVTQTFMIPNWERKWTWLKDWLKFRKVLVINPNSGQAVVAIIGDSGPATWTGKQFGGSPEVMHHIGYGEGPRKGEIIMMFIDDPEDKVPLGPVQHFEQMDSRV